MCDDSLTAVRRTGEVYDKNGKKDCTNVWTEGEGKYILL